MGHVLPLNYSTACVKPGFEPRSYPSSPQRESNSFFLHTKQVPHHLGVVGKGPFAGPLVLSLGGLLPVLAAEVLHRLERC